MIFLDNTLHAFQPIAVPELIRLGRKQLFIRRERIAAAAVDQCDHDHICIMMPDIKFNGGAGNVLRCLQRIIQMCLAGTSLYQRCLLSDEIPSAPSSPYQASVLR